MKKYLLISCCIIFPGLLLAQKEISVSETAREMSRGLQPAFMVNIPETGIKEVEKAWTKHLQKGSRSRVSSGKQELLMPDARVEGIQAGNIAVHSQLFASGGDVMLYAFFEIDSVFFHSEKDPDIARSIRSYLRDFAVETYRSSVESQLRAEENKLKAMERGLEGLRDEEKRNEKLIKENEREISKLQDEIKVNDSDEDRKAEEIERKKDLVSTLGNFPEEQAKAEKELKVLKKEKRRMQSRKESMHRKIDKLEDQIKKAERDIRIGKEKQRLQEKQNTGQEEAVRLVRKKLDAIR